MPENAFSGALWVTPPYMSPIFRVGSGHMVPQWIVIDVLRAYMQENGHEFIDFKNGTFHHNHERYSGYINKHDGRTEYLVSEKNLA